MFAISPNISVPPFLSVISTNKCFELVHADIWGPFTISSMKDERYFLTLVDDYSRFTWIHLMKNKSEVMTLIKGFYNLVHTQFGVCIKIVFMIR